MKNKTKRRLVRNNWTGDDQRFLGYNYPFNIPTSSNTPSTEDFLTVMDSIWENRLKQVRNTTPVIYTNKAGMEWYHKMFEDYIKQHFPKKVIWI